MAKNYEHRKLFRFGHTKLFDVTEEGINFKNKLYEWAEISSVERVSRRHFYVGIIKFNDGKKCKLILNTFRERGQKTDYFLGINTHFTQLEKIIYEYTVVIPREKKQEEKRQRRHHLKEQIELESDPLKKQKLVNELEALIKDAMNQLSLIMEECRKSEPKHNK